MPKTANCVLVATARPLHDYALLQTLLQADGIDVDHAVNFAQVTNFMPERPSALTLVDRDLPGVAGAEFCRQRIGQPGQTVPFSVWTNDLVDRLGGDEFAVLVSDATRARLAETAQRIVKRLFFSFSAEDGYRLEVTCSSGIAVHRHDGRDSPSLLKQADRAIYAARERGKRGFGFASEDSGTID